jgi:predicted Zn-ribbon and HTH transcriptional regulator
MYNKENETKGKKIMKVFVECKKCGFEVVPNEDGTCYNCSEPMEANE